MIFIVCSVIPTMKYIQKIGSLAYEGFGNKTTYAIHEEKINK